MADENTTQQTENLDVKTEQDSSTAQTDVNKDAASSAAENATKGETKKTLEDVIREAASKAVSSTAKEGEEEGAVLLSNSTKEEGQDKSGTEEQDSADEVNETKEDETKLEDEKKPVSYERFAEVNSKAQQFEQQVQEITPLAEAQRSVIEHCQQHGITSQQFEEWMGLAAEFNSNPEAAASKLQAKLVEIQGFAGDSLPADLQSAVNEGHITLDYAKRLARAEVAKTRGTKQVQVTREQMLRSETNRLQREMTQSIVRWAEAKGKTDPDFSPVKPKDGTLGKFELVMNEFGNLVKTNEQSIRTSDDLVRLLEQAYTSIGKTILRFIPKQTAKQKTIKAGQTGQSNGQTAKPKTLEEVIERAAMRHGVTPLPK